MRKTNAQDDGSVFGAMLPSARVRELQQDIMHGGAQAFDAVPRILKRVIDRQDWKQGVDRQGRPFTSFEAFVTHKLWEGLESSIEDLKAFCRKREDVLRLIDGAVGAAGKPGEFGKGRPDNRVRITNSDTATYALRRLKRDRPDLAAKVVAGELSANAAAIEAGFRHKPSPLEQILKLLPKLTTKERATLRQELGN